MLLACIQWWKAEENTKFYIINYKLLNDEDSYVQMRQKKFSENAVILNTKQILHWKFCHLKYLKSPKYEISSLRAEVDSFSQIDVQTPEH